jgi:acetylornithine deacetylase
MSGNVSSFEAEVLRSLDEAALVDTLAALVRVPSVGGSDAECEVQHLAADL